MAHASPDCGVEPARLARVLRGQRQRRHVGRRIRARRLELHDARVGEADVRGRVLRRAAHDGFEDLAGPRDLTALEALQRRASFDKRAERRQQRVERLRRSRATPGASTPAEKR